MTTSTMSISLLGLQEFKSEKFRGRYLTVSVARENFMEKLKREREESTHSPVTNVKSDVNTTSTVSNNPFRSNVEKSGKIIRKFDLDDEEQSVSGPVTEPDPCIKKKSKSFTENGKVGTSNFVSNLQGKNFPFLIFRSKFLRSTKADRWHKRYKEVNRKNSMRNRKRLTGSV